MTKAEVNAHTVNEFREYIRDTKAEGETSIEVVDLEEILDDHDEEYSTASDA